MYAVFQSGGKQYRAAAGDVLRLEKIDAAEGSIIQFDEVLLIGEGRDIQVGTPTLAGTSVSAKVVQQGKSRKVPVVKFRRRQNYLRMGTHRQLFTEVEITAIGASGSAKAPASSEPSAPAEKKLGKKAAPKKAAATKAPAKKSTTKKAATKKAAAKKSD